MPSTTFGSVLAGAVFTAAAMAMAGWALPGSAIVGPQAGSRIRLLVPQVEVSALLVLGMPLWGRMFRIERLRHFTRALAATERGPRLLIVQTARAETARIVKYLGGGALVWLAAAGLPGGPTIRHLMASRFLIVVFAVFGIGLGAWAWAALGRRSVAIGAAMVLAMAATPLAVAPLISTVGARPGVISAAMLACPWIVMAGATGLDLLRMEWLYAASPLGSLEAPYPGLLTAGTTYGGAGLALLGLAGWVLRRGASVGRLA